MNATRNTRAIAAKQRQARVAKSKRKVLLVDDDSAIRRILFRLLREEGYWALTAGDAEEALAVARSAKPDLVLLDLNLPAEDGWETFEHLSTRNPLVPIIVITGRPNQLFTARAAGVGALLEKPLDFEKLLQTVRNLLDEPAEASLARYTGRASMLRYAHAKTDKLPDIGAPEWGAN